MTRLRWHIAVNLLRLALFVAPDGSCKLELADRQLEWIAWCDQHGMSS